MSWKAIKRWVFVGTVALSVVAVGCGDDEATGDGGSSGKDGGGNSGKDGGDDSGKDGGGNSGKDGGGSSGKDGGGDSDKDGGGDSDKDGGGNSGKDGGGEVVSEGLDCNDPDKCVCGDNDTCKGFVLVDEKVRPCCLMKDAKVICGLNADDVKKANPDSAFEGCVEYEAPGVKSSAAGEFFDRTGADDKAELSAENFGASGDDAVCDMDAEEMDDEQFTLYSAKLGGIPYGGCCTPDGQFGVDLTKSTDDTFKTAAAHFGCKGFEELQASLAGSGKESAPCKAEKEAINKREADPKTARNEGTLPFCDPETGEVGCPPMLSATLCMMLKDQKVPFDCDGTEEMPSWVCAATGLPPTAQQQMDLDNAEGQYCMEGVPAFVHGCGDLEPEDCFMGIPGPNPSIFGCDQPENGNVIPGISSDICGCGVRMFPKEGEDPCISNVGKKVCGVGL